MASVPQKPGTEPDEVPHAVVSSVGLDSSRKTNYEGASRSEDRPARDTQATALEDKGRPRAPVASLPVDGAWTPPLSGASNRATAALNPFSPSAPLNLPPFYSPRFARYSTSWVKAENDAAVASKKRKRYRRWTPRWKRLAVPNPAPPSIYQPTRATRPLTSPVQQPQQPFRSSRQPLFCSTASRSPTLAALPMPCRDPVLPPPQRRRPQTNGKDCATEVKRDNEEEDENEEGERNSEKKRSRLATTRQEGWDRKRPILSFTPPPPSSSSSSPVFRLHTGNRRSEQEGSRSAGAGIIQRYKRSFGDDLFYFSSARAKTAAYVLCQVLYASAILPSRNWGNSSRMMPSPSYGWQPYSSAMHSATRAGSGGGIYGPASYSPSGWGWGWTGSTSASGPSTTPNSAGGGVGGPFFTSPGSSSPSAALMVLPTREREFGGWDGIDGASAYFAFYGSWWRQVRRTWELMRRVVKTTSQYEAMKRLVVQQYPIMFGTRHAGVKRRREKRREAMRQPQPNQQQPKSPVRRCSLRSASQDCHTPISGASSSTFSSITAEEDYEAKDNDEGREGHSAGCERIEKNSDHWAAGRRSSRTEKGKLGEDPPHSMLVQALLESLRQVFEAEDEAVIAVEALRKMLVITLVQFFLHLPVEECVEDSFLVPHFRRRRQQELWEYLKKDLSFMSSTHGGSPAGTAHQDRHWRPPNGSRSSFSFSSSFPPPSHSCSGGKRRKRKRPHGPEASLKRKGMGKKPRSGRGIDHNEGVDSGAPPLDEEEQQQGGSEKDMGALEEEDPVDETRNEASSRREVPNNDASRVFPRIRSGGGGSGSLGRHKEERQRDHESKEQRRLSDALVNPQAPNLHSPSHSVTTVTGEEDPESLRGGVVTDADPRGEKKFHTEGRPVLEPHAPGALPCSPPPLRHEGRGGSRPERKTKPTVSKAEKKERYQQEQERRRRCGRAAFKPSAGADHPAGHSVIFLPEIIQSVTNESRTATALRLLSRCLLGLSNQRLHELLSPFQEDVGSASGPNSGFRTRTTATSMSSGYYGTSDGGTTRVPPHDDGHINFTREDIHHVDSSGLATSSLLCVDASVWSTVGQSYSWTKPSTTVPGMDYTPHGDHHWGRGDDDGSDVAEHGDGEFGGSSSSSSSPDHRSSTLLEATPVSEVDEEDEEREGGVSGGGSHAPPQQNNNHTTTNNNNNNNNTSTAVPTQAVEANDEVSYFFLVITPRSIGPCFHSSPCFGNQQFMFVHCTNPVDWPKHYSNTVSKYRALQEEEEVGYTRDDTVVLERSASANLLNRAWHRHKVPSVLLRESRCSSRRPSYASSSYNTDSEWNSERYHPTDEGYHSGTSQPTLTPASDTHSFNSDDNADDDNRHQYFTLLSFYCSDVYEEHPNPYPSDPRSGNNKDWHLGVDTAYYYCHPAASPSLSLRCYAPKAIPYYPVEPTAPIEGPPAYMTLPPSTAAVEIRSGDGDGGAGRQQQQAPLLPATSSPLRWLVDHPLTYGPLMRTGVRLPPPSLLTATAMEDAESSSVTSLMPPDPQQQQQQHPLHLPPPPPPLEPEAGVTVTPGDLLFAEELYARLRYWQLRGEPSDASSESALLDDDDEEEEEEENESDRESCSSEVVSRAATEAMPTHRVEGRSNSKTDHHHHHHPRHRGMHHWSPSHNSSAPRQECFWLPLRLLSADVGSVWITLPAWDERRYGVWDQHEERGLSLLRHALRHCSHAVVCAMRESRAHGDFHDLCHVTQQRSDNSVTASTACWPSTVVDRDTLSRDGRQAALDDYPLPYTPLSSLLSPQDVVEDSTLATVRWLQGESPPCTREEENEAVESGASRKSGGGTVIEEEEEKEGREGVRPSAATEVPPPLCPWDNRQRRVERLKSEFRLGRSSRLDVLLVHERTAKPLVAITLLPFVGGEKESIVSHVIQRWPHPTKTTTTTRGLQQTSAHRLARTRTRMELRSHDPSAYSSLHPPAEESHDSSSLMANELIPPTVYRVSRVSPYVNPLLRHLQEEKILLVDLDRTLVDNAIRVPIQTWECYGSALSSTPSVFGSFPSSLSPRDDDGGRQKKKEENENDAAVFPYDIPRSIQRCGNNPAARKWWIRQWGCDDTGVTTLPYRHPFSLYFDWQGEIAFRPTGSSGSSHDREKKEGTEDYGTTNLRTENISVRPNMFRLLFRSAVMWGIPLVLVTKSSRARAEAILDQVLDPLCLLFPHRAQQVITADDSFPAVGTGCINNTGNKTTPGGCFGTGGGALVETATFPCAERGTRIARSKKSASLAVHHFEIHLHGGIPGTSPLSATALQQSKRPYAIFGSPTSFSSLGRADRLPARPRCVAVLDDSPQMWLEEDVGLTVAITPYTLNRVDPDDFTSRNGYLHVMLVSALFGSRNVRCCNKLPQNQTTWDPLPQWQAAHCSCMCHRRFCGVDKSSRQPESTSGLSMSTARERGPRGEKESGGASWNNSDEVNEIEMAHSTASTTTTENASMSLLVDHRTVGAGVGGVRHIIMISQEDDNHDLGNRDIEEKEEEGEWEPVEEIEHPPPSSSSMSSVAPETLKEEEMDEVCGEVEETTATSSNSSSSSSSSSSSITITTTSNSQRSAERLPGSGQGKVIPPFEGQQTGLRGVLKDLAHEDNDNDNDKNEEEEEEDVERRPNSDSTSPPFPLQNFDVRSQAATPSEGWSDHHSEFGEPSIPRNTKSRRTKRRRVSPVSQDPSGNAQIRDSEEESRAPQRRQQERSGNTIKKRRSRFNHRTGLGPLSEWMGHQEQQGRSHYRQTPPTPKDFRVSNEGATILPLARLVEEEEDKERKSAWVPCPTVTHVGGNAINTPDTAPHSNSEAEIELVRGGVVVDDEDNAGWGITSSTKPWAVDAEDVTPL